MDDLEAARGLILGFGIASAFWIALIVTAWVLL